MRIILKWCWLHARRKTNKVSSCYLTTKKRNNYGRQRKKGEFVGALGALLVHVAVIALLILVSFTVPQPDEDAGGVPVMLGNVESARGFDDPSLVDVDILPEEPEAPAPAETQPELPLGTGSADTDRRRNGSAETETEPKKETVNPKR